MKTKKTNKNSKECMSCDGRISRQIEYAVSHINSCVKYKQRCKKDNKLPKTFDKSGHPVSAFSDDDNDDNDDSSDSSDNENDNEKERY